MALSVDLKDRGRPERRRLGATLVPGVLAGAVVAAQVAYPRVTPGPALDRLTVVTVVLFFAASVTSAALTRGVRFTALMLAVTAAGGLLVEAVGVATGLPFGAYAYRQTLGPALLSVPVVIPLAWTMMAYPALVVARRITANPRLGPFVAGAALATWDLFLDPQMVAAGHWFWKATPGPDLAGIPVTNVLGWFGVATVMMAVLWRRTRRAPAAGEAVPIGLYLWTYASSVLAHAVYLDLPTSALLGGLGMGAIVVWFAVAERRS